MIAYLQQSVKQYLLSLYHIFICLLYNPMFLVIVRVAYDYLSVTILKTLTEEFPSLSIIHSNLIVYTGNVNMCW